MARRELEKARDMWILRGASPTPATIAKDNGRVKDYDAGVGARPERERAAAGGRLGHPWTRPSVNEVGNAEVHGPREFGLRDRPAIAVADP